MDRQLRGTREWVGAVGLVIGLLVLTACGARAVADTSAAESPPTARLSAAEDALPPLVRPQQAGRPNVVVVMMDDFSMDLLQTMRSAERMRKQGASYSHAYAVDSLCCVSRSSFFTGQYPHQTGVRTNTSYGGTSDLGGWAAFEANGNPQRSFNVRLQRAGYTTGFVGKYLNEYEWAPGRPIPPLPPGWSVFNTVFGSAYDGWDFTSTQVEGSRVKIVDHPAPPASATAEAKDAAYSGSVIENKALDFIERSESSAAPYFLEVAPYGPHNRTLPEPHYPGDPLFPPMFRDRGSNDCGRVKCSSLTVADLPGYGDRKADNRPRLRTGEPARAWNTVRPLPRAIAVRDLRDRARMVKSIDRMVTKILARVGKNTYVVLTSDNGFHLGQNGLARGKGTAYATDSHVPLLVTGPGVVRGARSEMVSNIDLAATVEDLAGLTPAPYRSGVSLVPTFADRKLVRRNHVFFEHTQPLDPRGDPDAAFAGGELERIPSFTAVRSRDALLVRLDLDPSPTKVRWGYEFYSYKKSDFERTNQFARARQQETVSALLAKIEAFDQCRESGNQSVSKVCRALTK